jgi:hypothetical protein
MDDKCERFVIHPKLSTCVASPTEWARVILLHIVPGWGYKSTTQFRSAKTLASDAEEIVGKNDWKIRAIDGLKFVSLTSHMIGEFFRDIAALIFIFVPLELWVRSTDPHLQDQVPTHAALLEYAIIATLVSLVVGFGFEYLSVIANRFKKDLEVNNGNR